MGGDYGYSQQQMPPQQHMPPQHQQHIPSQHIPPQKQQMPPQQMPQQQPPFASTGYGSPNQPTQQMHDSATTKRAFELLNESNLKITQDLATKDAIIEGKSIEIEKLSKNVKSLSEQLASIKASTSEKASTLEREIQMMKNDLEEGKISKAKDLESQRSTMQGQIDQINKLIEERDTKASVLTSTLAQIKNDQENESVNLGVFITKAVNAFSLATTASQDRGNENMLVVESRQDVGFASLTIKTAINADITFLTK